MIIGELIKGLEVRGFDGSVDAEITGLVCDARKAGPGSCYFALRGEKHDGHDFAPEAVRRGAVAVVAERPLAIAPGAACVVVPDSRRAMGAVAARWEGDPSSGMTIVGVTGTNGKTTTSYLIESILRAAGRRPGLIGTVEYRFEGIREAAPHTTPLSIDLQGLLRRMLDAGCDSCAMEVSSHAMQQGRIEGCRMDAGVFTNLTPEHLDYHGDMEAYFSAKAGFFRKAIMEGGKERAFAAINADDEYGMRMAGICAVPVTLYGFGPGSEVRGESLSLSREGLRMRIASPRGSFDVRSSLCGRFNAQNVLAASAAALGLGIGVDSIAEGVEGLKAVPGRFESVPNERGVLALVDYAHTPDALGNALSHARELLDGSAGRLIAVFGCGGDRDRLKRPLMGRAAAGISDIAIVTSDNPRSESPAAIIDEILAGVVGNASPFDGERGYEVIEERSEAIRRAVELARPGDVLIVAGKGHEDYQITASGRRSFDDRGELARFLRA